jgi:hypothetical protein
VRHRAQPPGGRHRVAHTRPEPPNAIRGTGRRSAALTVLSADELSEGTDNFADAKCIGEGGFGRVFLCEPLDGMQWAALLTRSRAGVLPFPVVLTC